MELFTILDIVEQDTIPSRIVTIYPLRGGVGLTQDPDSFMLSKFCKEFDIEHIEIPIGIQRSAEDKTKAELYLSPGSFAQIPPNSFVRIVDFGIATGGTMELLVIELIGKGIPAKKIYIQGAVGTSMAESRLLGKNSKINLQWTVTGQMDAELQQIHDPNADDLYYIKRLKQPGSSDFIAVSPTDWGDRMFKATEKWSEDVLEAFLDQLIGRFPNLTEEEINQLRKHYRAKMSVSSHS